MGRGFFRFPLIAEMPEKQSAAQAEQAHQEPEQRLPPHNQLRLSLKISKQGESRCTNEPTGSASALIAPSRAMNLLYLI